MISFFTNVYKKINNTIKIMKINKKYFIKGLNAKFDSVILLKFIPFSLFLLITLIIILKFNLLEVFITNFNDKLTSKKIIDDSLYVFNLYNKDNYILDEKEEKIETSPDKIENLEYKVLDDEVKKIDEINVFNTQNLEMNITENSSYVQKLNLGTMSIVNYSYIRDIDYNNYLFNKSLIMTKKSDKILLYNTHTSESYANSEKFVFEYSGTRRSQDASYNMLRISSEFLNNLNEKNFICIQETTPHDYGAYTSAYSKSRVTIENAIKSYGGFGLIIDVHRDAIEDIDFAPTVNINGVNVAKVMLVIGAGTPDYKNEMFEDNLNFALKLYYLAEKVYPGLFRPMYIRNSLYNQDINKYSILLEVGASGNTIDEAINSTRCITNLLNIIYKD